MLNFVFFVHAALAFLLASMLLFFTAPFTELVVANFTWPTAPGVMTRIISAYAYLTAVGLILIAIVNSIAIFSGYSPVRWAALIAMLGSGLVFILVSLLIKVSPLDQAVLFINAVFVVLYVWIWFFRRETV